MTPPRNTYHQHAPDDRRRARDVAARLLHRADHYYDQALAAKRRNDRAAFARYIHLTNRADRRAVMVRDHYQQGTRCPA